MTQRLATKMTLICLVFLSFFSDKGKSVKATVKDNSPWVTGNDIDLTTGAFTQLADLSAGTIDVQWSWV